MRKAPFNTLSSRSNTASHAIAQSAARWFIRMQTADIDSPERSQFEQWLLQSEAHQAEYASVSDAWNGIDSLEELQKLAAAKQASQFLNKNKRRKNFKNSIALLSVCFIVIMAGLFGHQQYQQWMTKPIMQMTTATHSAQMLTQRLDDGSEVTLNASSSIQITYYRHERHIALLKGEAIFNVTENSDRPFIVETDTARIKVLGTRFAVNKLSQLVRVSVDHGSVQLESKPSADSIVLHNGQVAEVAQDVLSGTKSVKLKSASAADYFKFTNGTIVFNQANIVEIADTLSRYSEQKVVTAGDSSEKISAVLNSKDTHNFINTLPKIANVEVRYTGNNIVIQSKQPVSDQSNYKTLD